MAVHPSAVVHPGARIHETAEIGPFCVVGDEVEIGPSTRLMAHVYVEGPTWIGESNTFYPYSTVGVASQDLKYQGERAETRIGNYNRIREFVTIHRGTKGGGALTSIADSTLVMAYAHVAHDCHIGSHCILANGVTLGGHVVIEDHAVIGAFSGVHQFCRVGRHAMVGGYTVLTRDVMPYSLTVTEREPRVFGENKVGLERRGFSPEAIRRLHQAFRLLARSELNTAQAVERIEAEIEPYEEIAELLRFIRSTERGVVK
ncbi:MAG: acyl-ACP--UDP-N-acetylglucosamine O-acyltransferase [Acidobacteria bacterium]|nr:acyl-ACP--UDP-N-acetylglucosamine O-acyltransferase [Acidobacteriota bacterium]